MRHYSPFLETVFIGGVCQLVGITVGVIDHLGGVSQLPASVRLLPIFTEPSGGKMVLCFTVAVNIVLLSLFSIVLGVGEYRACLFNKSRE